jgi:protein-L-isoaspartate(D-aspartate) O-methyltransferase
MKQILPVILLSLLLLPVSNLAREYEWRQMRERMIEEIKQDMYQARHYVGREQFSQRVLSAIGKVARHEFVPESLRGRSYGNYPLPIGDGQTISQPFIVALMTEMLDVDSEAKVLEIGTGSGYQAAVLAEMVRDVYTIEIVASLAQQARTRLTVLGYANVHVRYGDGMLGWPEQAPFDGIIVTAAGLSIPDALLDQLVPGARMIMPVGAQHETQQLKVIRKNTDGTFTERDVLPVRFVPITDKKR